MPKYTPIATCLEIKCILSDLIELQWKNNSITADWIIPKDDNNALRVHFDRVEIIRLLDEMPISTEHEPTPKEGLVADHFAYIVQGSAFWDSQSDGLKFSIPGLRHYRFVTGWTCLDVISKNEPTFTITPRLTP